MKTSRRIIAALLAKRTLSSGVKPEILSREVAAYLLETGRSGELESLMRDVAQQRAEKGVVEVVAVSAHELSSGVRADIETQVRTLYPTAKEIIISERLEPGLIGGIRLEFTDRQLDLSVRAQLNRLRYLTAAERIAA